MHNLLILTWSSRSIKNKNLEFQQFLDIHSSDVACIIETHLIAQDFFYLSNYTIHRSDCGVFSGGVAVCVKKGLNHVPVFTPCTEIEIVGIEFRSHSHTLKIVCVYAPPSVNNLTELISGFEDESHFLFAGDFNAKNTWWNCNVTNSSGQLLFDLVHSHNLDLHYPPQPTHIIISEDRYANVLDLFVSRGVIVTGNPWVACDLSSNHLPVFIELRFDPLFSSVERQSIDWLHLRYNLETLLFTCDLIQSSVELECAVSKLTKNIIQSTKKATTTTITRPGYFKFPQDIRNLIRTRNKLRRKMQRRNPLLKERLNKLKIDIRDIV